MTSPDNDAHAVRFELLDARVRLAVESVAAVDPNPSDPYRGLYVSDDLALALSQLPSPDGVDERLAEVGARFGLDQLELAVLALCAAPELSPHYGRLFAYLHDDLLRKYATPRLVSRLLSNDEVRPAAVLACFANDRRLRRTGAVQLLDGSKGPTPLAERSAKVGDRLAAYLVGTPLDEVREDGRLRPVALPEYDPGRPAVIDALRALARQESRLPVVVAGPDAALLLARALGRPVLLVGAPDVDDAALMREAKLACALEGRQLCFDGLEDAEPARRARIVAALAARDDRTFICARTRDVVAALGNETVLVIEAPLPTLAERTMAWAALSSAEDVEDVSAKFRLSIGQISDAAEVARLAAAERGATAPSSGDLDLGARQASSTRLAELAARLESAYGWDDLVLPARQLEVIRSISSYLRHRDLVLGEWGYAHAVHAQGLKALFVGESGTGKTMAGQVLARDLGLDLFRIDLATTVSKYIGETEKNLDRIFAAAEGSNAILFFDEADALFGKRSEVRDSHDRYANIEVAYLLQKMEAYPGAVILATNLRQNIDDAFLRRLDFVVDFPFPEPEDRERIWKLLLPDSAPLGEDIELPFLAQQFKLSGGAIRNCSLAAAFMAAEDGGVIEMRHLIRGVALEYAKLGRLTLESDFERYHELLRPGGNGGSTSSPAASAVPG